MFSDKHPDVAIYHDYSDPDRPVYLRFVPIEMPGFSHGIALSGRYADRQTAEEAAIRMQGYFDAYFEMRSERR